MYNFLILQQIFLPILFCCCDRIWNPGQIKIRIQDPRSATLAEDASDLIYFIIHLGIP
jgi:hypothetical protein